MMISASMLRLVWTVIEEIPNRELLLLTDTALVKLILQKIARKVLLTGEEVCDLYDYIGSRTMLIRDIAESRCMQEARQLQGEFIVKQPYLFSSLESVSSPAYN